MPCLSIVTDLWLASPGSSTAGDSRAKIFQDLLIWVDAKVQWHHCSSSYSRSDVPSCGFNTSGCENAPRSQLKESHRHREICNHWQPCRRMRVCRYFKHLKAKPHFHAACPHWGAYSAKEPLIVLPNGMLCLRFSLAPRVRSTV